jgi:isopropylmalate/homocitrate/citramalate synthase
MIEGPYGYEYNPAQQQERFDPKKHLEQMAMGQRNMLGHRAIGTEAMKESNISLNLERLDKILSQQEELVTLLEQKLTPFIRPYPKQMREEINQTSVPQSALAERLYHQTVRSDFLCGRINALIGSIDL